MSIVSDVELAAIAKATPQTTPEKSEVVEQTAEAKETLAEIGDVSEPSKNEVKLDASEKEETDLNKSNRAPGAEKRIKKLSREKNALRSENDNLRARVAALEVQRTPPQKEETPQKQNVSGKPKADDFADHEQFVEALTDWKIEQKEVKRRVDEAKVSQQKQLESYVAKKNEFAEKHDDFDEIVESVNDIPMSITVHQLLLEDGGKPELAYELAKNRDEFKRICSLSPLAAAKALGAFEAKLGVHEKPEPKKLTKAPKPIAPVGTKAKSDVSIYDRDLSQRDFERLREEQIKSQRN